MRIGFHGNTLAQVLHLDPETALYLIPSSSAKAGDPVFRLTLEFFKSHWIPACAEDDAGDSST